MESDLFAKLYCKTKTLHSQDAAMMFIVCVKIHVWPRPLCIFVWQPVCFTPVCITCAVSQAHVGWQLSNAEQGCRASPQAGIRQGMTGAQLSVPRCASAQRGQAGGWRDLPPAPKIRVQERNKSMTTKKCEKTWINSLSRTTAIQILRSSWRPSPQGKCRIDTEASFVAHQDWSC